MRLLLTAFFFFFSLLCSTSTKSVIRKLHEKTYALIDTDPNAALILADSSLLIAQETDLAWEEANSLYIKGYLYNDMNENTLSVQSYLKSIQVLDGLDDKIAAMTQTSVLLNVGDIFRKYHKYQEAVELLDKGVKIAEEWGFDKQKLKLLYNKATAFFFQGQLDQSLVVLNKAINLATAQNDYKRIIRCWNLFGLIHKEAGRFLTAKLYYQNIIGSKYSTAKDLAFAFHNLGNIYKMESSPDSAKLSFETAIKSSLETGDTKTQFISLYALAELHYENSRLKIAKSYARKAEALYFETERLPEHFALFHQLHLIYADLNQITPSSKYARLYHDESQKFYSEMKKIMRAKDEFHMDILLAHFKREQNVVHEKAKLYRLLTILSAIIIVLILITWKVWFSWWRRNLWNKVYHVFKTKNSDGSYKEIPFEGID